MDSSWLTQDQHEAVSLTQGLRNLICATTPPAKLQVDRDRQERSEP